MEQRKILWDTESLNELKKSFPNVSRLTIYNALTGKRNSEMAKRIRKRGLDLGMQYKGVEKVNII